MKRRGGIRTTFDNTPGSFLQNSHPRSKKCQTEPGNKLGASFPISKLKKCNKGDQFAVQPSVIKLFTSNPITVNAALKIMLANPNRTEWRLTNIGTSIVYIGLGKIPTATSYDHTLPVSATSNDGTGGVYIDDEWKGEVWLFPSAAGALVALVELP